MPHSCFGALTHHYYGLVAFLMSDDAVKIVEVTAAGGAIYRFTWKPLRKVVLPLVLMLIAAMTASMLQTANVSTFADRLKACVPGKVQHRQSPEPIKNSKERHANAVLYAWSALG